MQNRTRQNSFVRAVKRFLLSAFVVVTFAAYALENRVTAGAPTPTAVTQRAAGVAATSSPAAAAPATSAAPSPAVAPTTGTRASSAAPAPAAAPTAPATATSPAPALASSGYKDGTYSGPVVDVRWGNVQIQATIQGGKISDVEFLQYPNDRRTSVRINSIAGPELQQEALQAQSANVDIITGATLTSEGFAQSLDAALSQARNSL